MGKYSVSDPATGQTLVLEGDSPPTEDELKEVFTQNALRESYAKGAARLRGQDRFSRFVADQSVAGAAPALLQEAQRGTGEAIQGAGALTTIPVVGPGATYSPAMSQMGTELAKRYAEAAPSERRRAIEENPIVIAGKALSDVAAETHPVPPEAENALLTKVGRTVGGFVPPVISGPAAPVEIALQSAGAHLDTDFDAAKAAGKTDDEAAQISFNRATASGLTQAAIWAVLPKFLRRATDKWIIDKFAGEVGQAPVKRFLLGRAAATAEMGTLGAATGATEAGISGQNVIAGAGEGATGMGIIGLLSPHGATPREIQAREAFGAPPTPGRALSPESKAWAQSFGAGFAPPAETEMVRTSPDVLEPGRPPFIPLEQRPPAQPQQISGETQPPGYIPSIFAAPEIFKIDPTDSAARASAKDRVNRWGGDLDKAIFDEEQMVQGVLSGFKSGEPQPNERAIRALTSVLDELRKLKIEKGAPNAPIDVRQQPGSREQEHLGVTPRQDVQPNAPEIRQAESGQAGGGNRPEPSPEEAGQAAQPVVPPVIRAVEPGSIDPKAIVPAIRLIGGEVVPGKVTDDLNKKDIHNDIIDRHKINAHDIDQKGFSDPEGKKFFLDREAAAVGTGAPTAFEPERLHAPDLAKAQDELRGFPKSPDLPKEPKPGSDIFMDYGESVDAWKNQVRDWLKTKPENKAIVWEEHNGNFHSLTRNIGDKPWRVTSYVPSRDETALVPWGHYEYATREAALFEEAKHPKAFHDTLPKPVMTEKEIQGYKHLSDVPDKSSLVWYSLKGGIEGRHRLSERLRGTTYMQQFVKDSITEDGKVAFTGAIPDKDLDYLGITPLPTPATSGSVPVAAAPETITVRTATEPPTLGPRSTEAEKAAEMTAETGASPLRSAAAIRSDLRTATDSLRSLNDKIKKFGKLRGDAKTVASLQKKADALKQQVEVLRGELSQKEAGRERGPVKLSEGVTPEDGLLFDLVNFRKIPVFLPPGWQASMWRRLRSKVRAGGGSFAELTPNERDQYRQLQEVFPQNYEDDYGVDGSVMRAAYEAAQKAGIASELFTKISDARGVKLDEITGHFGFKDGQELFRAVEQLANAKRARVEGVETGAEGAAAAVEVKEKAALVRDMKKPTEGVDPLPWDNLVKGTQFTLKGTKFRVSEVFTDEDGRIESITLDDGKKYGRKILQAGEIPLQMDKGSLKQPAGTGEFAEPEPEPVTAPAAVAPVAAEPAAVGAAPVGERQPAAATKPSAAPAVDLFGQPIEEPKAPEAPKGPQEVQDMLGLAPAAPKPAEVQERPLNAAEKKEFLELSKIFKKWRDEGGEKPTTEETQRYEHLLALAGQKTLGLGEAEGQAGIKGQIKALVARLRSMEDNKPLARRGKKVDEWHETYNRINREIRDLRDQLTEGQGEFLYETKPPEELDSGYFGTRQFRVRKLTMDEVNDRFRTPDARMAVLKEYGTLENLWVSESRRMDYEDAFGQKLVEKQQWYADGWGKSREDAIQDAKDRERKDWDKVPAEAIAPKEPEKPAEPVEAPKPTPIRYSVTSSGAARGGWKVMEVLSDNTQREYQGRIQTKAEAQGIRDAQNEALKEKGQYQSLDEQVAAEQPPEPTPLTPAQTAVVSEAVKAAFPEGGAPDGTEIKGFRKQNGRWYKLKEDGSLNKIPTNRKQHDQLEVTAASPPAPPETRTPIEILKQASKVRVKTPAGATKIRVTDNKGRKSEISLAAINTGDNIIRGVDVVKIEAGHIDKTGKFAVIPGDVTVEDVGKRPKGAIARQAPSAGIPVDAGGLGAMLVPPEQREQRMGFPVYHGTPHEVDRFTTKKIGTGEGAQVYGWGLYFAEHPNVAEQYKKDLVQIGLYDEKPFESFDPRHQAAVLLWQENGDRAKAMSEAKKLSQQQGSIAYNEVFKQAIDVLREGKEAKRRSGGNVYTVDIDAKPDELLDWDKPLDEQTPAVKAKIQQILKENPDVTKALQNAFGWGVESDPKSEPIMRAPGAAFYESLEIALVNARAASARLAMGGLKGIRYLDQGSRFLDDIAMIEGGKWQVGGKEIFNTVEEARAWADKQPRTSNYVIWHEPSIRITAKNGERVSLDEARKGALTRAEPQPILYREKALRYSSVDELRKAVADPAVPLPDRIRNGLSWALNQKFVEQLPGLSFEIGDYLDGTLAGEYVPNKPLIRLLRFTDTDVPIHEFFHHLRMYLRPDDAAFLGELRRGAIQDAIAKAKDIADQRMLRGLLDRPLESDEFLANEPRGSRDDYYHLANEHEFFTWMMTEKALKELNRPEATTFAAKVRRVIEQLMNWARDTFGFGKYEDTLWRQILSGKYEFNVDDAVRWGDGSNQRKLSLPLDPKDYELRKVVDEVGPQAATIGGYLHRYEVQARLAQEMNVGEKARALDRMNKAREMTELALADGGKINYYDGRDNAATLGEKNEVIRSAFESVTRYQQLGLRLHRMLEEKSAEIASPRFRERMIRAAEKREKAEMLAEVKRTFTNQIAASAGRITATLESMRVIGVEADRMQQDLDRLRKLPDYSNAVAQKVEDIVNTLATDDAGISSLLAGGNKSGSDIFDHYMARIPLTGQPMPTGDSVSLLRLASAVLAANRDLRNEFTVLNLVARDVIAASDVNTAGRKIAEDLLNHPAKAVQRVARRAASLTDKATRAEAAWLALNRPVQRLISQWQMYDEAARLHDAVESDGEYRQYVNDVMRDSGGLYIPNEIRQKLAAPESPTKEPFFEFSGIQTLYAPDGQEFQINMKWTPRDVGEVMGQLAMLKGKIDDWLDAPENQNSPARQYWEEREQHIESALMSSAIWNPSAITPFHIGKWGFGAWGMPETFYQGLALPQAKLAFVAQKNFDRLWTQGKGWYAKNQPIAERLTELAYKSHPEFNDTTRKDYQRTLLNVIGWELRHQREVHVGDVLNGVRVTKADMDLFHAEARQMSELYDILWAAGDVSGAADVMELPRIMDEFSGGAWGIRRTMEIGANKNTTLPRSFSKHGENLATNVHLIVEARDKALRELPAKAVDMTPEEVELERADIRAKFNESMTHLLNDPDRFNNFILGFMRQRSSDWLKHQGLSPFEEHYRQMTEQVSQRDPAAPGIVDEVFDYLDAHTDAEWNQESIKTQFFNEITKLTEQVYKLTAEHRNSNATIMTEKHDTAFNRAFSSDVGPSYFYDYGWIDAGEMRKYSTDMASFAFDRMMVSMHALRQNMSEAISEMSRSALPWKAEQIRQVAGEYRQGQDFRDLQHLEDKLLELDRMIQGVQKWMGNTAMHAEGISLKTGSRIVSDFIGMALTGTRTATRISGISMGGSAWKMGNVFSQLGWGKLRSTPAAALSAIISMSRLGTSTVFGWYFPETGKLVPGIPARMLMNIPKAAKAALKAKGTERFYQAIAASLEGTTDEQFAALKFWFDQKQLGMTPDNPIGARVANIMSASRSKGGVLRTTAEFNDSVLGKAWRGGKLVGSKVVAVPEAGVSWIMSYLPTAFGYNITYDAVGRQAGWYIDMLSAHARRTFETYEKLNQLGRFNFDNLSDPRNRIAPWEALPSFLGRMPFINPAKLPSWARPNSTNLHFARELFSTSTDVDLQDLLMRYWKRLSQTPKEQRGAIEFLAPEEMDAAAAEQRAMARARGIVSRFVEQTHHAAPSNRPYQLQRATAFQSIMPFLGWSSQTIKQLGTYWGRAAYSAESQGQRVDSKLGLIIGTGLMALMVGAFAFLGGDFEVRVLRRLDRLLNRKETTLKTVDEVEGAKEKAEIIIHNMTAGIPLLNSALNTITGATGYRGTYGFQAFAFDKVNTVLSWLRGVYRTHDLTYGLDRLVEANLPISETIIENLFERQGMQNSRNAVRVLQKFGPQDLVQRRASASTSLPTELTPYRQDLVNAVFSGKPELAQQAYQAFVQKATELGRTDPEAVARQVFGTLNPYRQAFGSLITDQQRAEAMSRMSDVQRDMLTKAETAYAGAAAALGLSSSFSKEESVAARGTRGTTASGVSAAPAGGGTAFGTGFGGGRLRGGSAISTRGTSGGIGATRYRGAGVGRLRGRQSGGLGSRRLSGAIRRPRSLVRGRLRGTRRTRLAGSRVRRRLTYA